MACCLQNPGFVRINGLEKKTHKGSLRDEKEPPSLKLRRVKMDTNKREGSLREENQIVLLELKQDFGLKGHSFFVSPNE